MPDQNINFKITANSKQAEDAFKRVAEAQRGTVTAANEIQKTAMGTMTAWRSQNQLGNQFVSTLRTGTMFTQGFGAGIQGLALNLDGLVDQYERANIRGLKFTEVLKQSFSGVSGFAIGITGAITAFSLLSKAFEDFKLTSDRFTLDNLIGELNAYEKSLKAITKELHNMTTIDLSDTISQLNIKLLETLTKQFQVLATFQTEPGGAALLSLFGFPTPEQMEKEVKKMTDVLIKAYSELNTRTTTLPEIIVTANKETEKHTGSLEKQKVTIGFISVLYENILSTMESMSRLNPLQQTNQKLGFSGQVPIPNKPVPSILISEAELKEYNAFLYTTMTATAYSVGNAFKQMWHDVFGEANNLLTDFIGNIINSLIDLAARGLAVDLLNLVFPGAGLLGGLGLFGSQQPATLPSASGTLSKSTNVYNINIGNQTVAQIVTEGYNTAVRLRKL